MAAAGNAKPKENTGKGGTKTTTRKSTPRRIDPVPRPTKTTASVTSKPEIRERSSRIINDDDEKALSPARKKEIMIFIYLAVSIFMLCSNFGICGAVGRVFSGFFFGLIGWSQYLAPFYLFFAAAFLLSNGPKKSIIRKLIWVAAILLLTSWVFQLVVGAEDQSIKTLYMTGYTDHRGGGVIFGGILVLLYKLIGKVGVIILTVLLSIVSVIQVTGISVIDSLKKLFAVSSRRAEHFDDEDEYYDGEYDDDRYNFENDAYGPYDDIEDEEINRKPAAGGRRGGKARSGSMLDGIQVLPQTEEESKRGKRGRKGQDKTPKGISKDEMQELQPEPSDLGTDFGRRPDPFTDDLDELKEIARLKVEAEKKGERPRTQMNPGNTVPQEPDRGITIPSSYSIGRTTGGDGRVVGTPYPRQNASEPVDPLMSGLTENTGTNEQKNDRPVDFFELKPGFEDPVDGGLHGDMRTERVPRSTSSARNMNPDQSPDQGLGQSLNQSLNPDNSGTSSVNWNGSFSVEAQNGFPGAAGKSRFGRDMQADTGYSPEDEDEPMDPVRVRAGRRTQGTSAAASSADTAASAVPMAEETKVSHKDTLTEMAKIEQNLTEQPEQPMKKPYRLPPVSLLAPVKNRGNNGDQDVRETALKLKQTLESFGVNVTVTNYSRGPAVTRYELTPEVGVKVSRIVNLQDDIKLGLAAADIRIEAPIPGKSAVGIEVPNKENQMVSFRELVDNDTFRNAKSKISFAIGKDISGQLVIGDIAKMPHMLIAGATGSGKSVCINTIIMSILYKAKPEEVRLIMIDPKMVELTAYNGIPHMLIPVVTDAKKAAGALNWAVQEMEKRYRLFARYNVRNLEGFNKKVEEEGPIDPEDLEKADLRFMPQIVVVVDELADLMMVAHGEVEDAIVRLSQLARAAGIHLIIATQRPSVDVITGLIKANVPSRIAFAVSSGTDSRTILDMVGAEKLLGKGDMLYYPTGLPKPVRVQGAFVSDDEVMDVTNFIRNQCGDAAYDETVAQSIATSAASGSSAAEAVAEEDDRFDEYFEESGRLVIEKDKASIGYLQRVFRIGFNRAARIMDQLAEAGVVGPEEGTKPRKILMTMDQFEEFMSGN